MAASIRFYTFSYQNPERASRMVNRFAEENLNLEFTDPVEPSDSRVLNAPKGQHRTWAIMWNHMDMLKQFMESDAEFGVFCEDDITIRRNIGKFIHEAAAAYKRLNLEILLLGYLIPYKPTTTSYHDETPPLEPNYTYISYGDHIWGSQMYMLDRATAQKFLNLYTVEYAISSLTDPSKPHFSPDWTLTKVGKRAAIYPMLAVEEGIVVTGHQGQIEFHRTCHEIHYDPQFYH
jgi:hypothetical protein